MHKEGNNYTSQQFFFLNDSPTYADDDKSNFHPFVVMRTNFRNFPCEIAFEVVHNFASHPFLYSLHASNSCIALYHVKYGEAQI